jgi:hypothetical protein
MAQTLKLLSGTATTLDLLTGNLRVRSDGWTAQACTGEGDPVWDTFSLVGRGTSDAALGTAVYNLQEFCRKARTRAENVSWSERLWLYWKPEGGSELRTLVTNGELVVQSDPGQGGLGPLLNSDGFAYVTLALEHTPWWESATLGTASAAGISMNGGTARLTVTPGDLSSRVRTFQVSNFTGTTALDDLWAGIRPTYAGTTNFKSRWECELGVNVSASYGTASDVGDTAAINGTAVQCTFADNTTMGQRFRVNAFNIMGTASDDMTGRYLALGRLKCGTSTEFIVDLYHGLGQLGDTPQGIEMVGETKVTNNLYKLVELGNVQIPPTGLKIFDDFGTDTIDTWLYIYAQRISGTGNLWLDCIVLIPSEHMLTMKSTGMAAGLFDWLYYRCGSDGKSIAYRYSGAAAYSEIVEHTVNDFTWPPDGGMVIFAGQGTARHVGTALIDVDMYSYPRYSLIKK